MPEECDAEVTMRLPRSHSVSSRISEASESILSLSPDEKALCWRGSFRGMVSPFDQLDEDDGHEAVADEVEQLRRRSVCGYVSAPLCESEAAPPACQVSPAAAVYSRTAHAGLGGGSFYL
jgi:hypothetical protein